MTPPTSSTSPHSISITSSLPYVIVGAGLGGLATAIRLASAGHRVEVWERNLTLGGKLQEVRDQGFRWDVGPSLLTMPAVLENLFTAAGRQLTDYLTLVPLETTCRYRWADGTVIDEDAAFWARPEVARFLHYAQGIYELSGEAYLHYPPEEFWRAFTLRSLPALRHLPKVATTQTLAEKVDSFFTDPHLRQLFYRFATYNGSSPYRTPATFNIIPYVEQHFGGWYPRGGLARIPEALGKLALELGVTFHFDTTVSSYDGRVLRATNGISAKPKAVICNQDVLMAAQTWLASSYTQKQRDSFQREPLSCSGFVVLLGVNRRYPQLAHHNIFFSEDYAQEFTDIFNRQRLPEKPTIYVSVTSRTDPEHAPVGMDNYFVLVNSPSLAPDRLSEAKIETYAQAIIERLEKCGLEDLPKHVISLRTLTCHEFATRDLSHHGSLYGWASHSIRASLLRPPLQHPNWKQVYFVGGTTHPGGGIPLVLLSAQMVANKILRER
jgi:phytoene desaturase